MLAIAGVHAFCTDLFPAWSLTVKATDFRASHFAFDSSSMCISQPASSFGLAGFSGQALLAAGTFLLADSDPVW